MPIQLSKFQESCLSIRSNIFKTKIPVLLEHNNKIGINFRDDEDNDYTIYINIDKEKRWSITVSQSGSISFLTYSDVRNTFEMRTDIISNIDGFLDPINHAAFYVKENVKHKKRSLF